MEIVFLPFTPPGPIAACVCVRDFGCFYCIIHKSLQEHAIEMSLISSGNKLCDRKLSHKFYRKNLFLALEIASFRHAQLWSDVIIFSFRIRADKCNSFEFCPPPTTAASMQCMMRGLKYITFLWLTRREDTKTATATSSEGTLLLPFAGTK